MLLLWSRLWCPLSRRSIQVPAPPTPWPPLSHSPAVSPQPRRCRHYWAKPRPHCQVKGHRSSHTRSVICFKCNASLVSVSNSLFNEVMSLLLFSESDLDDCRFPCQGNSPRESLSSQYVLSLLFWYFWWLVHDDCPPLWLLRMNQNVGDRFAICCFFIYQTRQHSDQFSLCRWVVTLMSFSKHKNRKHPPQWLWGLKKNTNHSHSLLLGVSQLGCSSDLFPFLSRPSPHPGLPWAVFLSCSTRETG